MTRLEKRVTAMEERQPVGCATCRLWHGAVIEDSFGGRSRRDHRPNCGREVPARVVIFLDGIHWDCV